jgi:hypothetical protein
MPLYQISYDLNTPGQDYPALDAVIETSHDWNRILDSTWLVWTAETAEQLESRLLPAVHRDNRLFLSRVGADNAGWMPNGVWGWVKARLRSEAVPEEQAGGLSRVRAAVAAREEP